MFHAVQRLTGLACFAWLALVALEASAITVHDEAVDGDISGDRMNPTHLSLSAGVNSLIATTGPIDDDEEPYDQEYVRIDLPAGHQLSQLIMQQFTASFDDRAFIGVQSGTMFSFDPIDAFAQRGTLLGWSHFGPGSDQNIGDDILPDIGNGGGAIGFTPPLMGSSYTFWLQQTGEETSYQLDFVVTAIPEPLTLQLIFAALVPVFALCRRRNRLAVRPWVGISVHSGSLPNHRLRASSFFGARGSLDRPADVGAVDLDVGVAAGTLSL
jgi:hypothetical protein